MNNLRKQAAVPSPVSYRLILPRLRERSSRITLTVNIAVHSTLDGGLVLHSAAEAHPFTFGTIGSALFNFSAQFASSVRLRCDKSFAAHDSPHISLSPLVVLVGLLSIPHVLLHVSH